MLHHHSMVSVVFCWADCTPALLCVPWDFMFKIVAKAWSVTGGIHFASCHLLVVYQKPWNLWEELHDDQRCQLNWFHWSCSLLKLHFCHKKGPFIEQPMTRICCAVSHKTFHMCKKYLNKIVPPTPSTFDSYLSNMVEKLLPMTTTCCSCRGDQLAHRKLLNKALPQWGINTTVAPATRRLPSCQKPGNQWVL